jgi:hypothetical protein
MTRPALLHYQHVLDGVVDAECAAWLQGAFRLAEGGAMPLWMALGLPAPPRLRKALRDFWLACAADVVGSPSALHRAASGFERRYWPVWRNLEQAPSTATAVEGSLFLARRAAPFPTSRRAFAYLLRGKLKRYVISRPVDRKPGRTRKSAEDFAEMAA